MLPLCSPPLHLFFSHILITLRPNWYNWYWDVFSLPSPSPWTVLFFLLMSHPAPHSSSVSSHVLMEINTEPKETNQRMVALRRQAQQAPTFVVTWSELAHGPRQRGGEVMEGWRASGDVKFDLWKDEMAGDQRVGAGWKGLGAGWNNATNGGHVEEKWMRWGMRESERSSGRQLGGVVDWLGWGGGCISWKILFLWLECRTGVLIYNVYHGSRRDFHTYKMEQHHEVSGCRSTAGNRLWGIF